eukprot:9377730-Alexandrium_andersonii.AAC.1
MVLPRPARVRWGPSRVFWTSRRRASHAAPVQPWCPSSWRTASSSGGRGPVRIGWRGSAGLCRASR